MPHPPEPVPDALTYQMPVQFGMLYWVNFGYPTLPAGIEEKRILDWHPALVVSGDPFCRHAGAVNVVALTSYRGKLRPYHHLLLTQSVCSTNPTYVLSWVRLPTAWPLLCFMHYINECYSVQRIASI